MNKRLRIWVLAITCFIPLAGVTQSPTADLLEIRSGDTAYHEGKYDFRDYLYIFIDSIKDRPVEEVAGESFQSNFYRDTTDFFNKWIGDMGKDKACVWARLTIASGLTQEEEWLVSINAGDVVFFVPYDDNQFLRRRTGTVIAVNQRPLGRSYGNLPCLPFLLPEHDTLTVYFKLRMVNSHIYNDFLAEFDRAVFKPMFYASKVRSMYFNTALAIGILLAVAIYHFFIFFFQRQNVTLYFGFFVVTRAMIIFSYAGHLHEFFFPNMSIEYGGTIVVTTFLLGFIFNYLFSRKYLQLPQILPKWDRVWGGLLVIYVLSIIHFAYTMISAGGPADADSDFAYKVALNNVLPLVLLFYAMIVAILSYRKGVKVAGLYLLAMSAYFLPHIAAQAGFDNIVNLPSWVYSFSGEVVMVLLFTLGIARQLKTLHDTKLAAENTAKAEHAEAIRLKGLDEFKTRFFTNITHEFRTPLTIILGMADQIKNQPSTWLHNGTKMIRQNGLLLLNLINQILDLSKLEAGSLPVQHIQGNIIDYIRYLVRSFQSRAQQKYVKLDFKADVGEVVMDYDPDKMATIVANLTDNAIKFTPKNGSVRIHVEVLDSDHSVLKIKVEDDGPGVSEKDLPHIFNRYYRGEQPDDRDEQGAGIGLALTKELVHLLKGEINVQNLPAQGTVFTILLPITNEAQLAEELPRLETVLESGSIEQEVQANLLVRTSKPTVLIVEDNRDVIIYISSLLQSSYILLTAMNGKTGLESALKNVPDLIISDVMMPEMDGFEMTRRIKEDQRTSHIPIVLLTAKADIASRMQGLGTGADAYLAKPFNKEELFIRLEKLIELRNTLRKRYRDFRFLFEGDGVSPHDKSHAEDVFIKELQRHIEENLSNPDFGISELCKSVGLSRSQLYRKFKALTNSSIAEFMRLIRLQKARHLLRSTNLNVTEVSIEMGFKNLSTFSRSFTDHFGISPSMIVKE